jgi:transcriptional regulator with XRE-family HTH domain
MKMNGQEMRLIRRKLGLTQEKFGELMGVTGNSIARQERGEMGIREPVARLARLLSRISKRGPSSASYKRPKTRNRRDRVPDGRG